MLSQRSFRFVFTKLKILEPQNARNRSTFYCNTDERNYNKLKVIDDPETRLLKVGIIGVPNSGKSTLINYLMDRKTCPTSSKVHTTRSKSMAVFTEGDSQVVFLDTPGLVNENEKHKYKLGNTFLQDPKNGLNDADIIGVVHDVSNNYTRERLDIKIIHILEYHNHKPSFLILNKIDLLKSKRKLLDITRLITDNCIDGKPIPTSSPKRGANKNKEIRGWPYFKDIFMVSALIGDGLHDLKSYLMRNAKPAKWEFSKEVWTDQTAESLIQKLVQAKLLDFLPQEIPYLLKAEIELLDVNEEGTITTSVVIKSPSLRISKLVAGAGDGRLRQIIQSAQDDLQNAFKTYVRLRIILDPSPNTVLS
ncbi:hypothetical protein ABEB36_008625 [Hypothenemus hampei]|uniref:GTPase Era, mitochondrial n=1 Tax=Hypothenemus hampei TaxID=57062 RepID=A0ABD1EPR2_HYPHA